MHGNRMKPFAAALAAATLMLAAGLCQAADQKSDASPASSADPGLYVKVQLPRRIKLSKLKPGDVVEGTLARDVYSADHELFTAGRPVHLTVDHLERRRRASNDHWPWVINLFTPRHENYPAFKSATVVQAQGESTFQVSLISVNEKREVHAQAKRAKSGQRATEEHGTVVVTKSEVKHPVAPLLVLEAFAIDNASLQAESKPENAESAEPATDASSLAALPTGTQCKILLLGDVSASKSTPQDVVQARLLEPVLFN